MRVKISKKELSELLWDSSRLGVSLSGGLSSSTGSSSGVGEHGQLLSAMGGFTSGPGFNGPGPVGMPTALVPGDMLANPQSVPMVSPPLPIVFPGSLRFLRPGDGTQPAQDLHGTITQEQCIQLASQMHKHVQLLLQNLHLFASSAKASDTSSSSTTADNPTTKEASNMSQSPQQSPLDECKQMIEELQIRGERAQQCKAALLAKLNPGMASSSAASLNSSSNSQQELLGSRRVTRSLTAAHAAVAHPSMFELVGSYALDELSSKFQANCSLQERNKTIQEQMLEVDKHLLATKKKNPKKPFTHSEDNLLAHGVRRFALHADSWAQIEKNFLPGKPTNVIQRRYRYLASNKTGMSAVKEYHSQFPKRRDASWILEEDLRIARGLIEFHNDNRRFARVGMNYLPHRSRLEIRKRWERLRQRFYPQVAELSPEIDDTSIDFTVLVKDLLEDKLRDQVKEQSKKIMEAELSKSSGENGNDLAINGSKTANGKAKTGATADGEMKQGVVNTSLCTMKNLHPALFFTSWALINPAVLLGRTCEHNWPSFIEDMSAQSKDQANPTAELTVPEPVDTESLTAAGAPWTNSRNGNGVRGTASSEPFLPLNATQGLPANLSSEPGILQAVAPSKSRKPASPEYDSEPSTANTSALLDEDEDDDSDYEHDELVSSDDGENASDSEEFEQLELSDDDEHEEEDELDDDDDDDDDSFDYEELDDSGDGEFEYEDEDEDADDDDEDEALVSTMTPCKPPQPQRQGISTPVTVLSVAPSTTTSQPQQQQTTPPVRHPLRLQNLQKPGNERMKRLLAALERRIVGKSVHSPVGQADAAMIPPAARPSGEKRRISRVSLETTQSLGPTRAYGSPIPFGSEAESEAVAATSETVGEQHEALVPDFDLETSEELESLSSGDDSFECEELNDEEDNDFDISDDDGEEDVKWFQQGTKAASGGAGRRERTVASGANQPGTILPRLQQQQECEPWTPNKKIRLLLPNETCQRCGSKRARCGCVVML